MVGRQGDSSNRLGGYARGTGACRFYDGAVTFQPYPSPSAPTQQSAGQEAYARPRSVEAAFWIAVVAPVLSTMLIAVDLVLLHGVYLSGLQADPEIQALTGGPGEEVVRGISVGVLVFYVVLTALWIVFGVKMRAGRNWARITLTVFAALWLVNGLDAVATGSSPAGNPALATWPMVALAAAQSALAVVVVGAFLVLAWVRRSNGFFAAGGYPR